MGQITGIGGIFMRAANPDALATWYREQLGIPLNDSGGVTFHWTRDATSTQPGTTTWALFPIDTGYFGRPEQHAMVNFRVDDLAGMLDDLRAKGVEVLDEFEDSEFGRFGWCIDPEGNRIELWEPPEGL